MKKSMALRLVTLTIAILFFSCNEPEKANLSLNSLFSDHMVLQQQDEVAFWGNANPSEKITVNGSWGEEATALADGEGHWSLHLKTPDAGGPFKVTLATKDSTINLNDVLIGEVWLASGQSNMEMPLTGFLPKEPVDNYEEEVAEANYPQIRFIDVGRSISPTTVTSFIGEWKVTTPETAGQCSAAAYFFARKLNQELNVPIGIITSTWGGTPVESWISSEKIVDLQEFKPELEAIKEDQIAVFQDWYAKFPTLSFPTSPETWEALSLEDTQYASADFDDADWKTTDVPVMVETLPTPSNDGAFWFRKTFEVEDITSDYTLSIPEGIDDMDIAFLNGKKVGSTAGYNTPRNYTISKSILVKGENTLAIRVIDTGGGGGFMGELILKNNTSDATIPMVEGWKYQQIAGIQTSNFLLFHKNQEALQNPPKGIETFNLNSGTPTVLFNGMIHPLIPFTLKGAIWYQGESNVGRAEQYLKLFPGMIEDWRERWGEEFPFYFVQIAPFSYGNENSPALRDAQRKSLATPKTGMAITMDIGLPNSIHPGNKQDVGDRLARLALANDYGSSLLPTGPLYRSHDTKGNKISITFDFAEGGLMLKNTESDGFEIAGSDKNYVKAKATIVDDKIEVHSSSVKNPVYVRYAWKDYFNGDLFNMQGLPASSFSTE
ncbi:MAG: sialate O-acetylesterase [Flavobacteriaceae bacterium]